MRHVTSMLLLGAAGFVATTATAAPVPHHRLAMHRATAHRVQARQAPYESSAPYYRNSSEEPPLPYVPRDDSASSIILRRTIQAQSEPGLTSELAPDSRQTATGGPVGGVPGFGGGGR